MTEQPVDPSLLARGRGLGPALVVPVAFLLANAASYALLLVAAHRMSSPDYGALSSLLGLLLISTIPMLALQTVAGRRVATVAGHDGLARGAAEIAALATVLLAVLSPALARFLHLPDVLGPLLVAATVPATAVLGTAMGIAQGGRSFPRLALLILAATGGRSLGGLAGLLVGGSPDATLIGVLAGTVAAAAVVVAAAGHRPDRQRTAASTEVVRESLHAAHAHGTFLLLTSLDVLLARHVLTSTDAGVYSVGSVITRATVWLPQSLVMLLFASLADRARHRVAARQAVAAAGVLGAACVLGAGVLGGVVVSVVGGDDYHRLDRTVWLYALLGALLALLQLTVIAGLALRDARRAGLLWVTIAADVVIVLASESGATPTRLVLTLVGVTGMSAAVAVWLTLRALGPPAGVPGASSSTD